MNETATFDSTFHLEGFHSFDPNNAKLQTLAELPNVLLLCYNLHSLPPLCLLHFADDILTVIQRHMHIYRTHAVEAEYNKYKDT